MGSARRKGWSRKEGNSTRPARPSSLIEVEMDDDDDYDNVNIIGSAAPLVSFGPSVMYDVPADDDDEGTADAADGNYFTVAAGEEVLTELTEIADTNARPGSKNGPPSQQSIMVTSAWQKGKPIDGVVPTSYVQVHLQDTGLDNTTL